jgi:D-alanyl-D-alanine dipeptidase
MKPEDILVDVIALSKKRCSFPIEGVLAYATRENFLGRVVDGYFSSGLSICLLSRQAADQLCSVQNGCNQKGLGLFIFDAYRPLRAVRDFSYWFRQPSLSEYEKERKILHYPHLEKTDLTRLGYAADTVSSHCFGSSVDLSLIDLKTSQLLDMGTIFDYFDKTSHHPETPPEVIGQTAYRNRQLLSEMMQEWRFEPYPFEYWHFEYRNREIDTPIDLEITPLLAGINV